VVLIGSVQTAKRVMDEVIVDKIDTKGVPYKCRKCGTLYVWKPEKNNNEGKCRLYFFKGECKETSCEYYQKNCSERCPVCGETHNEKISATKYKFMRAFRSLC